VRNQRADFQHKAARALVNRFGTLIFEDVKIKHMSKAPDPKPDPDQEGQYLPNGAAAKAGLNQSILDAGWGQFQAFCVAKAASAGRAVVLVDPYNTSQQCSGCKEVVPKDLEVRTHVCPHCGLVLERDHNAAINMLRAWKRPTTLRGRRSPARKLWGTSHSALLLCAWPIVNWPRTLGDELVDIAS
jgi:putative transposase